MIPQNPFVRDLKTKIISIKTAAAMEKTVDMGY
jgi:hypothetical protein